MGGHGSSLRGHAGDADAACRVGAIHARAPTSGRCDADARRVAASPWPPPRPQLFWWRVLATFYLAAVFVFNLTRSPNPTDPALRPLFELGTWILAGALLYFALACYHSTWERIYKSGEVGGDAPRARRSRWTFARKAQVVLLESTCVAAAAQARASFRSPARSLTPSCRRRPLPLHAHALSCAASRCAPCSRSASPRRPCGCPERACAALGRPAPPRRTHARAHRCAAESGSTTL